MEIFTLNLNNQRPVRVGRIGYINVDPIYYALDRLEDSPHIEIISAPPSELNAMMASDQLDISSVSSVAYARHQDDWLLLPGLAVACIENVMSVLLVGKRPIESLDGHRVAITDESATAAALLKLMFAVRRVSPSYKVKKIKKPSDIGMNTAAALVIGDSALRHPWNKWYEYTWDLGDLWARHTGLPFVFAVWAVRKSFYENNAKVVAAISEAFLRSKSLGLTNLDEVIQTATHKLSISEEISDRYFKNFCYTMERPQLKGLQTFYQDLFNHQLLHREVSVRFIDSHLSKE